MYWTRSNRCDPFAREIADRHYNRQNIGATGFVPPGRCLVLICKTDTGQALWVTSYPYAQYVKHAWAGAWVCSIFRNEGAAKASLLIKEALQHTIDYFGNPPEKGMITFINTAHHVGYTKSGLMAFQWLDPYRWEQA